jgi:Cu(I)/Ag(I) efflux system membrane fusion protein/cobalt-zinc-cadmium efflux system membrane fusion protein
LLPLRRRTAEEHDALALPAMTRGMQAFAMTLFFLFGIATAAFILGNPFDLAFFSRSRAEPAEAVTTPASTAPKQLYQCPMHPEVIEEQPGECPICTMKLMPMKEPATASATAEAARGEREILYWYAPMDPTYVSDTPGKSPMGMDLVPKYADETSGSARVIQIDPVQVQNIGVVSQAARLGDINRTVRTVGILDFNADDITWINTKFSGWIEKVHVTYVGQEVKEGDALFEIYSPELVTTQEEYLRALDYKKSLESSERLEARRQAESLLRSTRDRLLYWDISEEQIRALETRGTTQRRLTIFSPANGVVTEVMDQALEGMFVEAGMNLYKIADLSTVWVHADVYETDLPWVRENQPAEVSFRYDPDRIFRGQILFLYPEVSKETRTLKICVEVPNEDRQLRAGMYADVIIHGPPVHNALLIPNSAVLRSGERDLVFVDLGKGRFEPRRVTLGIEGDKAQVQILSGLAAGDAVVTQSQFMLDSESRVQEAIAKFLGRRTAGSDTDAAPPAHD